MESDEYKPKASAKVRTRYHIVLVTKYRKRALAGIEKDVLDSIRNAERHSRFIIHRINTGDGNRVHMLISIPPDMTISGTVSRIKQLTTHELWDEHPDHLGRYYWGKRHKTMVCGILLRNRGMEQRKHSRTLHRRAAASRGDSSATLKTTRLSRQDKKVRLSPRHNDGVQRGRMTGV